MIREKNQNVKLISWGATPAINDLPADQISGITFLESNNQYTITLGNELMFKEIKMEEVEKKFNKLKLKVSHFL